MQPVGRRRVLGLGLAALFAWHARMVVAQGTAGLDGRVMDDAGVALANALVTVVSFEMPEGEVGLTTDEAGAFHLGQAPPGLYDVYVTLSGYQPGERRDLRLQEGQRLRVEIKLTRREGGAGY